MTRILDHQAPEFDQFDDITGLDALETVRVAHHRIAQQVSAVHALSEYQPASETLRRGRGSCSQRMAVLEAAVRRRGMATRVRGLVVAGSFWHARFPGLRRLVPDRVLLAWPEFRLDGEWVPIDEVFPAQGSDDHFTNDGPETLFDALGRGAVHTDAAACGCTGGLGDATIFTVGTFASRDDLFSAYGQNVREPIRGLINPVVSRWATG